MKDRYIRCDAVIPEEQQVCIVCQRGGRRMMKNGSGAPVPTEQEAIGNITKEENRHIKRVIDSLRMLLGEVGLELVEICVRDRKSRKKYGWKE